MRRAVARSNGNCAASTATAASCIRIFFTAAGRRGARVGRKTANGTPLILHNIGGGTQENDILFSHELIGHFRPRL